MCGNSFAANTTIYFNKQSIIVNEDFLLLNVPSLSLCSRPSLVSYSNHIHSSDIRICLSNSDSMFIEKLYLALETLKEEENKNLIIFLTTKQNLQAHLTNISLFNTVSDYNKNIHLLLHKLDIY